MWARPGLFRQAGIGGCGQIAEPFVSRSVDCSRLKDLLAPPPAT